MVTALGGGELQHRHRQPRDGGGSGRGGGCGGGGVCSAWILSAVVVAAAATVGSDGVVYDCNGDGNVGGGNWAAGR